MFFMEIDWSECVIGFDFNKSPAEDGISSKQKVKCLIKFYLLSRSGLLFSTIS